MYNISRTGLGLLLSGMVAIAIGSSIVVSDTITLLGIWLATLILTGCAGLAMQQNAPDKDAELVREIDELKETEKERNEFFSGTVEKLRIPLISIDGHVELLLDRHLGKITKQQSDSLHAIKQEINHITRMIIDITELATIETGDITLKKEEVSLGEIINDITDQMQQAIELKGNTLTKDVPPDLPVIYGDRNRLASAFANIIGNAIKFTSEGNISVNAHVKDGELLVSVSDTGIGIPEDAVDKVFDRFYKVDATSHGTGLGLRTAKRIIEMHGGKISAESGAGKGEGRGSTFRFTIPLSQPINITHQ